MKLRKQSENLYLQVGGDFDVANGGERGEVAVGSESSLGKNGVLQGRVGEEHVGELPPYLLRHHCHSPRLRHAPYRRAMPAWVNPGR